jgi:hypothetical protein
MTKAKANKEEQQKEMRKLLNTTRALLTIFSSAAQNS